MRLKTLPLLILLLLLIINPTYSQPLNQNNKSLENELGIDYSEIKTPEQIETVIQIILEESDKAIESSYNEGYKQAVLEYKPELDFWKQKYEEEASFKNKLEIAGISFTVGIAFTSIIALYLTR